MIRYCRIDKQIHALRELLNLSQSEFATKIGITQGALSQLESGKVTVSLNTLYKINQAFDVDFNWLIKGSGHPFDSQNSSKLNGKQNLSHGIIPLVNEEAHAGYVSNHQDADYLGTLDVYKIPGYDDGGDYRLFEVVGDSMLPSIHDHETVIAERIDKENIKLTSGALAIVVTSDGLLAKRVYLDADQPDHLILHSDNPKYEEAQIALADIKELWAIRAKITSVFTHETTDQEKLLALEEEVTTIKQQMLELQEITRGLRKST